MKTAVVVFPGSNCDRDIAVALEAVTGTAPAMVWHGESALPGGIGLIALPAAFLRRLSALRRDLGALADRPRGGRGGRARRAGAGHLQWLSGADRGGAAAGCADAQRAARFRLPRRTADGREQPVDLHQPLRRGRDDHRPVAHHDGNYFADDATLDRIEGEGRVAFRYASNVNGSARGIAGVLNAAGTVLGMMPHPERRIEAAHGGSDGRRLFEGLLETVGA